jgi:hypothetical protein
MNLTRHAFCLLGALASSPLQAQSAPDAAEAAAAESGVRGVNPAELNNRIDVIGKVINLPVGESMSLVGKYDMKLGSGFGANFELPVLTHVNSTGINATGTGDLFTRVRYVRPLSKQMFLLGAVELVVPVASETATGTGKWQLNPAIGGVYMWNLRSFSALIYKNLSSIAGDSARPNISTHQFRGLHTFVLKGGWYVTGDVKYEVSTIGQNEDWVTTEFELGRQLSSRWAASVRVGKAYGDRPNDGTVEINIRTFL